MLRDPRPIRLPLLLALTTLALLAGAPAPARAPPLGDSPVQPFFLLRSENAARGADREFFVKHPVGVRFDRDRVLSSDEEEEEEDTVVDDLGARQAVLLGRFKVTVEARPRLDSLDSTSTLFGTASDTGSAGFEGQLITMSTDGNTTRVLIDADCSGSVGAIFVTIIDCDTQEVTRREVTPMLEEGFTGPQPTDAGTDSFVLGPDGALLVSTPDALDRADAEFLLNRRFKVTVDFEATDGSALRARVEFRDDFATSFGHPTSAGPRHDPRRPEHRHPKRRLPCPSPSLASPLPPARRAPGILGCPNAVHGGLAPHCGAHNEHSSPRPRLAMMLPRISLPPPPATAPGDHADD